MHGAHGVVVSHPLRMRKALGSNPSVSISYVLCVPIHCRSTMLCHCKHRSKTASRAQRLCARGIAHTHWILAPAHSLPAFNFPRSWPRRPAEPPMRLFNLSRSWPRRPADTWTLMFTRVLPLIHEHNRRHIMLTCYSLRPALILQSNT